MSSLKQSSTSGGFLLHPSSLMVGKWAPLYRSIGSSEIPAKEGKSRRQHSASRLGKSL